MVFVRSLLFNLAFYLVTAVILLVTLPVYFFLSHDRAMGVVRQWAKLSLALLAAICGTRYVVRGRDNTPPGGCIVASKHQSAFETIALVPHFADPTYVMKQSIR